jgi:hypothetical protein
VTDDTAIDAVAIADGPTGKGAPSSPTPGRALVLLGHLGADATVAIIWVAIIVAIVLFSGVVSQFAYVDF